MRILRLMGVALALAPAMRLAQAQAKPAEQKATSKPAMQHDMSAMGHDTAMKHNMAGMGPGTGMGDLKSGWKELDAFHTLAMSVSAAADKGDLTPAREKAKELTRLSEALAASRGPMRCDNTEARMWIPMVVRHAKSVAKLVEENGGDAKVRSAVEMTHKEFQKVARPCFLGTPELSDRDLAKLRSGNEARLERNHPAVQKKP